jgi:hypothetical protein
MMNHNFCVDGSAASLSLKLIGEDLNTLGVSPQDPCSIFHSPLVKSKVETRIIYIYCPYLSIFHMLYYFHTHISTHHRSFDFCLHTPLPLKVQTLALSVLVATEMLKALSSISLTSSCLQVLPVRNMFLVTAVMVK